jgi:protein-disulfide isomerase
MRKERWFDNEKKKQVMLKFVRFIFVASLFGFASLAAQADNRGFYPLKGDDGDYIANHRVPAELAQKIDKLPGVIVVGNPKGKVTLAEFYDVNCPYCRTASNDIDSLLKTERELRLVLVPFPVLGAASVTGTRVELAVLRLAPEKFYDFHRRLSAMRGRVDGSRALEVAKEIGLNVDDVLNVANDDSLADVMKAHLQIGNSLVIMATPGFVIKDIAILGYPGRKSLAKVIESVARCNKVICEGRR